MAVRLKDAVSGHGAVRAFRIMVMGSEYEKSWKEFRDHCLEDEARQWCNSTL